MQTAETEYFKGRGAQFNAANPYLKNELVTEHEEGLDEPLHTNSSTQFFRETPKKIINKVDSPDIGLLYSMNPYQGCEHGCIYCYARNSHQYWGFSAGLDFERKIIIKENAPELLEKQLSHPKWKPQPIMLSGNTDCYQPIERKLKITRKMLEVLLKFRHPVGVITKNSLILRDLDILSEMAKLNLVNVSISITSLDESLRQKLEPRTASAKKRLKNVEELSKAGIPVNIMVAPVIPGLNSFEIPEIIKQSAAHGALSAAYTIVRLNGSIAAIFENWIRKAFPNRAEKVLNQIAECHSGKLNDSRWGTRMKGQGNVAESIAKLFRVSKKKYLKGRSMPPLDLTAFNPPGRQFELF
ncbi:MAG: radical SAM protein [Flavobacteriales bacterium]|nr:MAG: radical SAM protein [Flavobacteriales bacterium]